MYRIIMVDNDVQFVACMKEMICRCQIKKEDVLFEVFCSGREFVSRLNGIAGCDLLILDTQIQDTDGHDAARLFRERFPHAVLVYCSESHPTDESFKAAPFRYLSKGYEEQAMLREMQEVIRKMQSAALFPVIIGKNHGNLVSLQPDDILYIANSKAGSVIYLCPERMPDIHYQVNTKQKLADLYQELAGWQFAYAHNSYLVNLRYVKKLYSQGYIQLTDGTELNVSRSKQQNFRSAWIEFLEKSMGEGQLHHRESKTRDWF